MTNPDFPADNSSIMPPFYIGLPVWQHSYWPSHWFAHPDARQNGLAHYARAMNSIEGNTTFYALPDENTVQKWASAVPAQFRFTFKWHQSISHAAQLDPHNPTVARQQALLSALGTRLSQMMLQLPATFGPPQLSQLAHFLDVLAPTTAMAVEVRHPAFFAKGDAERALNQLLISYQCNRIIMDTRALFTGPTDSVITSEVRTKKPRVPVNVIATGNSPIVRFVGNNDEKVNRQKLMPWVDKCHQWRREGKTPFLFLHRPDNKDAPWLAHLFITMYNERYPQHALPGNGIDNLPTQDALF